VSQTNAVLTPIRRASRRVGFFAIRKIPKRPPINMPRDSRSAAPADTSQLGAERGIFLEDIAGHWKNQLCNDFQLAVIDVRRRRRKRLGAVDNGVVAAP
jgi:hypothetical protein